jgi:SAM-dependent methyltransferase
VVVSAPLPREPEVIWHELECASYEADLSLWLELAALARGPILDVAAGTGRVAHALARAGFPVTALERDARLIDASRTRSAGLPVQHVCADARSFALSRRDFALCIVPMHSLQLFGPSARRAEFLRCAHAHLRLGGMLACAVLYDAEPFDCRGDALGPVPESVRADGLEYVSTPTSVAIDERAIVIERERLIRGDGVQRASQRDVVELARVRSGELAAELLAAGFVLQGSRSVPATEEHVGSDVVLARA